MYLRDLNEVLADDLRDPEYVTAFLENCLADGEETFLTGLREVARANGGMTEIAKTASLGRESLYKALSTTGNPEFRTVQSVLKALGLRLSITRAA